MTKKGTTSRTPASKKSAPRKASKSRSPQAAKKDLGAAVEAAQRYAEDLQTHATDGLKTAVEDVQQRQKKLQGRIADIGKKSKDSVDSKVAATEKALGDFDAFIARVGAGIDKEWETLNKRASALRKQLERLKAEAVKRTDKGYAQAEKAVEDFDKFVERNAASLEKDVLAFIDRAEPQLKSLRDTIALYSDKSAEMARAGSSGAADLWKDLKVRQKNAQKQFSLFSKSSARAWKDIAKGLDRAWSDMEKAGRTAASRYGDKAKPPAKKPVKAKTGPAGASTKKKTPPAKKVAKQALAKPAKS